MHGIAVTLPGVGGRMQWMDALRGGAIMLVLLWHAVSVPALFDWDLPQWVRSLNHFFLPYRMPTLMFLSGLLLPRALGKARGSYFVGKVRSLVWPYVLWCLVYFAQYGTPAPLYVWRVWYATGYLWFLCFITIYYVVAPLVTRLLPSWLIPWICIVVSIAVPTTVETRLFYFASFFFFGYWFAQNPRLLTHVRGWRVGALALVAVMWGIVSAVMGLAVAYQAQFTLFGMCGVLALCWGAMHLRGRVRDALSFVGRHSLVYYVAHFPVMTAVVWAAEALRLQHAPILWFSGLVAALVSCTLLALYRSSPWVGWLFEMPYVPWRHGWRRRVEPPQGRAIVARDAGTVDPAPRD